MSNPKSYPHVLDVLEGDNEDVHQQHLRPPAGAFRQGADEVVVVLLGRLVVQLLQIPGRGEKRVVNACVAGILGDPTGTSKVVSWGLCSRSGLAVAHGDLILYWDGDMLFRIFGLNLAS